MWAILKAIFVVVALMFGISITAHLASTFTTVATAPGRVVQRTLETDNIIYNYEWFKRQHEQVSAAADQLADAEAEREIYEKRLGTTPSFQQEAEYARLNAIVLGLRSQRRNYVAEYNARARMANRNIFMGNDLPPEIR